jgi:hypothetical protein
MKQLKFISVIALSLCYLFTFNSCKKSEDSSLQLPPASSMTMDFNFTSITKSASETQTQVNHGLAALSVSYWSLIAYAQTAVPAAAFKKALENTPVYNSTTKMWEWSYVTTIGNDSYNSKLTGSQTGDSVEWKMYLSQTGNSNITNYLWFEGKSHQGRTGGWWILNYPRTESGVLISDPGLKITWSYTSDQILSLKYLYIASKKYDSTTQTYIDNVDKGGYIEFGRTNDSKFDCYYTIYSLKELKKYDILWNLSTKAGQIKLNGTAIGCWDTNLEDIACSN